MPFDPDLYLARKKGVQFKDPSVMSEYSGLSPDTKLLAMNAPQGFTMTSGKRSPEENYRVGGVPNSDHLKGDAFDARMNTSAENIQYFKDKGYQVLDEGDHYHVQRSDKTPIAQPTPKSHVFDPDSYLARKRSKDSVDIPTPKTAEDTIFGNPVGTGLRNFAKSGSFGLSEPASAGLAAAIEKPLQWSGKAPERSLGDAYNYYRSKQEKSLAVQNKANPISAKLGDIAGYVAPGTAMSKTYGATTGVANELFPMAAKSLAGRAALGVGKAIVRGGGAGALAGAIDPEQTVIEGGVGGALGDIGGSAIGASLKKGAKSLKKGASRTVNRMLGAKLKDLKRGENIGEEIVDRGMISTKQGLKKKAETGLNLNEEKLDALLEAAGKIPDDRTFTPSSGPIAAHSYDVVDEAITPTFERRIIENISDRPKPTAPTFVRGESPILGLPIPEEYIPKREIPHVLDALRVPEHLRPTEPTGFTSELSRKGKSLKRKQPDKFSVKVSGAIPSSASTINRNTVLGELQSLRKKFSDFPGNEAELKAVDEAIEALANKSKKFLDVAPKQANKMKRDIYRKLTDTAYDKDVVPIKKDIMKATARGYRKAIEEVAPEASAINQELAFYGRLNKAANEALAKAEQGGSNSPYYKLWRVLRDVGAVTGGAVAGGPAGGIGALALTEGLSSGHGMALRAKGLNAASKGLSKIPANKLGAISGYKTLRKKDSRETEAR